METFTTDSITLYNGDCNEVIKTIEDGEVSLLCTDPPYTINNLDPGNASRWKSFRNSMKELNGIDKGYGIESLSVDIQRVMGGGINAYFWCNKQQILDYLKTYVDCLGCKYDILIWHKTNTVPTFSNKYLTDKEYCLYFRKGKGKLHPKNYEMARTVFTSPMNVETKKNYNHPSIKPLNIIQTLVENTSDEGDLVFDPFTGSGTTAIACLRSNRRFVGCEIDKTYFDIAVRRIKDELSQPQLF